MGKMHRYSMDRGAGKVAAARKGQISAQKARLFFDARCRRRWRDDVIFYLNLGVPEEVILENLPDSAKRL